MRLLSVDTIEEARGKIFDAASERKPETETVHFTESCGRVLADDILAEENVPGFRKSTVDGYAVKASNTQGVSESVPVFLDVVEEIQMGTVPRENISDGQTSYVPTGGMLPDGADAVVMIEYTEKFDEKSIAVYDSVSDGRNVIQEGEDIAAGEVFMKKGSCVRPQEIGVMASAGVTEVEVFRPWEVTVISTGDELVSVEGKIEKGQTRDINTYSLSAAAEKHGFHVADQFVLRDDRETIKNAISRAMERSDIVLVSGGSSQGEKDYTADIMDELSGGGLLTHGIAIKPGKPTILAYDRRSETILAGLPGHPAAALLIFEMIIGWLHRQLTCQKEPARIKARVTENVAAAGGKATCLLVELRKGECGIYEAEPVLGKSGLMTVLTRADGYAVIDTNSEGLRQGETVEVTLF